MPISGTLIGTQTEANQSNSGGVSAPTDTIDLTADVATGEWIMLVQLGGYAWQNPTSPFPHADEPMVNIVGFEDMSDAAFAAPGNYVPETNHAVQRYALNDSGSDVYVDDSYPVLLDSAIGLLAADLASSHTITIDWGTFGLPWTRIEAHAYFLTKITAPFDTDGAGSGVWLDGSTPSAYSSPTNIASGTDSYSLTINAAAAAAAGKGAAAIVAVAWDDTSLTPTLPDGWTQLSTYADTASGWAGLLAGRTFSPGDSGPYTFAATFSSSVKSATCFDTWQLAASSGIHIAQRF